MASQRDAARPPMYNPPPDQLASFHSLIDKVVHADALCRDARAAELAAKAAEKGEALFGTNSLVVVDLRMQASIALANQASSARGAKQDGLQRRAVHTLLTVIALLQRRLADHTLLPGTVRKEELDYYEYAFAATFASRDEPVPPPMLQTIGYNVLLDALFRSLTFLRTIFQPLWPDTQRKKIVESFLRALPCFLLAIYACPDGAISFRYLKP